MAGKAADKQTPAPKHESSEADQAKAMQWFRKARDCAERREYDYGVECFITGLAFWPEAVDEGHKPLRAVAFNRVQVGGKKPSMMEGLKKPMSGKDVKQNMLNAEHLMSKDPTNGGYIDGVLKNAVKAGFYETARWVAPIAFESMRKEKKPNAARFKTFRSTLEQAGDAVDELGDVAMAAWFFEEASKSLDYLVARNPTDMGLKTEQRNMSGKLAIARGKYEDADSFRDSLQDGDKQKLLHDTDRVKQGEQTLDSLIAAARQEVADSPGVASKVNALVDVLMRCERRQEEDEAIALLLENYTQHQNYSFKLRADDIRLRRLERQKRRLDAQAQKNGDDDSQQQARLATIELIETQLEVYQERCEKYPTDLRIKYRLGAALAKAHRFDEAIPVLQEAQGEPKHRTPARLLIGQCFYQKKDFSDAVEVLRDALEDYEISGDDMHKGLMYWLARAQEGDGSVEDAAGTYSKLVRLDYNYAGGDARKRLDALKQGQRKSG